MNNDGKKKMVKLVVTLWKQITLAVPIINNHAFEGTEAAEGTLSV